MEKLSIALDWWPNVLQIGFFVAENRGFYKDAGISPEWIFPDTDRYRIMPSEKARAGTVDLAVNPPENLIYANTLTGEKLLPVAALLQSNTSCFALTDDGLSRIANSDLPIRYPALGLPFEEFTVNSIVNACFPGRKVEFLQVNKDEIYPNVLENRADMAWIFEHIEGIEWEAAGKQPHYLSLHASGIPYPCCPLLMTSVSTMEKKVALIEKFKAATGLGYMWAIENAEKACDVLCNIEPKANPVLILKMIQKMRYKFVDAYGAWGEMDPNMWNAYEQWLEINHLIPSSQGNQAASA